MNKVNVVAWDTATNYLSVAIVQVNLNNLESYKILYSINEETKSKHSKILATTIETAIKETDLKKREISLIAVGKGPGSFTGLRTGLAVAKGFSMGLGIPLMPISTLDILAYQFYLENKNRYVASIIDARHDEVFVSFYDYLNNSKNVILDAQNINPNLVLDKIDSLNLKENISLVGPNIDLIIKGKNLSNLNLRKLGPSSVVLACLAAENYKNNIQESSIPLYIRKPDIW